MSKPPPAYRRCQPLVEWQPQSVWGALPSESQHASQHRSFARLQWQASTCHVKPEPGCLLACSGKPLSADQRWPSARLGEPALEWTAAQPQPKPLIRPTPGHILPFSRQHPGGAEKHKKTKKVRVAGGCWVRKRFCGGVGEGLQFYLGSITKLIRGTVLADSCNTLPLLPLHSKMSNP